MINHKKFPLSKQTARKLLVWKKNKYIFSVFAVCFVLGGDVDGISIKIHLWKIGTWKSNEKTGKKRENEQITINIFNRFKRHQLTIYCCCCCSFFLLFFSFFHVLYLFTAHISDEEIKKSTFLIFLIFLFFFPAAASAAATADIVVTLYHTQ